MAEGDSVRSQMINGKKVDAKFDLMIYSDSPSYASIATIIKENCRKIGVDVGDLVNQLGADAAKTAQEGL